jgi:cyclophilin family peptidyl-prolyl cis-trans isomerase
MDIRGRGMIAALSTGLVASAFAMATPAAVPVREAPAQDSTPIVVIETSLGNIVLELDPRRAPNTVANFLAYVGVGFYDGLIFHRVIPDALVQTGLATAALQARHPVFAPIQSEADNRLRNRRGTIAMARTDDPHSAEAQFFINVEDNRDFDFRGRNRRGWGYTVFGRVVSGLDVVDAIASGRTRRRGSFRDFPTDPVVIYAAYEVDERPRD